MLNPFPIQFLAILAYAILRVIVGLILVYLGILHIQRRYDLRHALILPFFPFGTLTAWCFGIAELIAGGMFIAGYYTQIAALVAIALSFTLIIFNKRFSSPYFPGKLFYLLLFAASLSLFITGAGAFAFDLPI